MKDLASLFTAAPTSEQRITDLQNISDTAISIFIQLPTVGEGETRSEETSAPQCVWRVLRSAVMVKAWDLAGSEVEIDG